MFHGSAFVVIFVLLHIDCTSGQLWCYECNVDLSDGLKSTCNDPYLPPKANLTSCPQYEPYHCLKSIILYKTKTLIVRSCIPSRQLETYCTIQENDTSKYPKADIECFFCETNACNRSHPQSTPHYSLLTLMILLGVLNFEVNK